MFQHAFSLSLSQNVHTKIRERAEERKKERKEEGEVNISTPVIQLQGQQRIDRSIAGFLDRDPGPCERG